MRGVAAASALRCRGRGWGAPALAPRCGTGLVARFGDPGPSPAMASPSVARALAQQGAGLFPEGADRVQDAVGALREEARALLGEGTRD